MSYLKAILCLGLASTLSLACGEDGSTPADGPLATQDPIVGDECNTTQECQQIHGSQATDCLNSQSDSSVCMCGAEPCEAAPPPPPPSDDECDTTQECKSLYGNGATDCLNSQSDSSICMCGSDPCDGSNPPPPPPPNPGSCPYLIAYDADGNIYDYDDIHATAMSLALIARAGMQDCVVHFAYNTNLDGNLPQAADQRANVEEAIRRYGYDRSVFFDVNGTRGSAYQSGRQNFSAVMNSLNSNRRLVYILAGPMQVPYDFIVAGPNNKEQFVTALSHSFWNDQFARGPRMNACWDPDPCECSAGRSCSGAERNDLVFLSDLGIRLHKINDQNPPAFNSGSGDWTWLRQLDSDNWLFEAVTEGPKSGDASDAGMTFYVLTSGFPNGSSGSSNPTMGDVRSFFGQ